MSFAITLAMFLLSLVLWVIVIALRIMAGGVDLARVVSEKALLDNNKINKLKGKKKDVVKGVFKVSMSSTASFLRLLASIIARIRDLLAVSGVFLTILGLILLMLIVSVSGGFLVLFTQADSDGGVTWNPDLNLANYSSKGSNVVEGSSNLAGVKKPEGVSEASWNSADEVGKRVASYACSVIDNPPNGQKLKYMQGDTPVGYADCTVFVCGAIEGAIKKTFDGSPAPNGYDFSVNCKADLTGYRYVPSMEEVMDKDTSCIVGQVRTSIDKARPGDVLLRRNRHVSIYVGQLDDGRHILVNASDSSDGGRNAVYCFDNPTLTEGGSSECGYMEVWGDDDYIIRTSKLVGGM